MADVWGALAPELAKLVEPIIAALSSRHERKAAKDAASLAFWPDGMVGQLELIAQGHTDEAIFKELKKQLKESREPVEDLIESLKTVREKLAGKKGGDIIVNQINLILFDRQMSKNAVRERIQWILDNKGEADLRNEAMIVCNDIDALNAAIRRLSRMVHGD
jgi:hypothetical protein